MSYLRLARVLGVLAAVVALGPVDARAADPPSGTEHAAPRLGPHPIEVPRETLWDEPSAHIHSHHAREEASPPRTALPGAEPVVLALDGASEAARVDEAIVAWVDANVPTNRAHRALCSPAGPPHSACAPLAEGSLWARHAVRASIDDGVVLIDLHDPLPEALGDAALDHLIELATAALVSPAEVRSIQLRRVDKDGRVAPVWPTVAPDAAFSSPESSRPVRPLSALRPDAGPLAGRRVAVSPGHGLYWTGTRWTTQRSDSYGLLEDDLTATISFWHLDPYLRAAGADVVWVRERDRDPQPGAAATIDDAAWDGAPSRVDTPGAPSLARAPAGSPVALAWTPPGPFGPQAVYARWSGDAGTASQMVWRVEHVGGVAEVAFDGRRSGAHWQALGRYVLDVESRVVLDARDASGGFIEAEAVLFGTSTASVRRSGAPSGQPGWRECARNYAEFSDAPSAVWAARATERDSDVVARPLWANRLDVDAYLSVHTNAAGGTGTETFMATTNPTAGSAALRAAVHTRLVADIRAEWNPSWTDRGLKDANFGELRELIGIPGALVEIAFHDRNPETGPDVDSLHSPRFRRIAGRALARGVIRYFDPVVPFVPEPPRALSLRNTGDGLVLDWGDDSAREGAGAADAWVVEAARVGRAFGLAGTTAAPPFLLADIEAGEVVAVRVRGRNAGGVGLPSTVVAARHAGGRTAPVLLVSAFTRWDRATGEEGNTFDYLIEHATALGTVPASEDGVWVFDGATEPALDALRELPDGGVVVWQAGEQSTVDETFSTARQQALRAWVDAGGRIVASGAEIGWDLEARGSASDTAFLRDVLGAIYRADDAQTYEARGADGTAFASLGSFRFDDGTAGTYDVDFPDVLDPAPGGAVVVVYSDGRSAAVASERAVVFGFPLETVIDPAVRAALLDRSLTLLEAERVRLPDPGPAPVEPGEDAGWPVDPPDAGDVGAPDPAPDATDADRLDVGVQPDAIRLDDTPTDDAEASGDDAASEDILLPPDTGPGVGRPGRADAGDGATRVSVNDACGCRAAPREARWGYGLLLLLVGGVHPRGRRRSRA